MTIKRWAQRLKVVPRIDPGFGVVLVIALIALWPFLSRASLPQETDAELHVFRLMELSYLVRNGVFYPRWAPDFYHGYGYPIFNFYAPLTYYVGLVVELLPRLDAVSGIKFVLVFGLLLSAWGMYGFVRDNWGRGAGYVATAVYIYAPYIQFIDPHLRGVAPESFSFGLFAMALWCLDRLRRRASWWRWITAIGFVTAVILSHNLMGLLFFGLLASWVAWQVGLHWLGQSKSGWQELRPLLGALILGLGLAAFFWLPVILERNAVDLNSLIGSSDNYDFRTHFLSVRELLGFSRQIDWGATEPVYRLNVGVAQWVLGGLGLLLLLLRQAERQAHLLFFAVALLVLFFLQLSVSQPVWEAIPLLPFFQFPWRLLGATSAMLAVLAGAGTAVLLRNLAGKKEAALLATFVAFPMLLALPLSQPAPWGDFGEVNRLRLSIIEQKGRWLGTTSTSDYIPATVDDTPRRNNDVVLGFYEGRPLDRVNRLSLPADAVVTFEEITPLHTVYQVRSPEKFRLRLFQFDFPGWHVTIDGEPVETELGLPEGFLVIVVPAGAHEVVVSFGSTPGRTVAGWITAVSLLVTALFAFRFHRKPNDRLPDNTPAFGLLDQWVLAAAGLLTAVALFIIYPAGWLHASSTGLIAEPAQVQTFADFGQQIGLIGLDRPATALKAGDQFDVNLYWKAQHPLDINYQSFVHVLRSDGSLVTQSDHLNPGNFPTRRWGLDKYVRDAHILALPADLPPGTYTLTAGLWVQTEGWRLPLLNEAGQQISDVFELGQLTVIE